MMYSPKATVLRGIFPDSRVLPMIKTHEPRKEGGGDSPEGLERLRSILGHRIDLDNLIKPEAVDYLCRASGGYTRDLIRFVRHCIVADRIDATLHSPITLEVAERAVSHLVDDYSRQIPMTDFPKLALVHLSNSIPNDAEHQAMLYNQSILEYSGNPPRSDLGYKGNPPWHDVHPAVQQLPRFQEALNYERARLTIGP
jgi:hypothetical protein